MSDVEETQTEETPAVEGVEADTEVPAKEGDEDGTKDSKGEPEATGEGEEGDKTKTPKEAPESEGEEELDENGKKKAVTANEFKPSLKFKASIYNKETRELEQKEYDIDKRFHGLMKDQESEKLVRELHEKAYGLDSVKERFNETRTFASEVVEENRSIKASIDGLRKIYKSSVETQNPHKLDAFFERLKIPQEVILNYALAKVQLQEMDPVQRQALMGQLQAEKKAEELADQQAQQSQQVAEQSQQMKLALLDSVLVRPDVSALSEAFDARVGKPGAFKAAVIRQGQFAWATEKKDLSPEQAVQEVISHYNLTSANPNLPAAPQQAPQQTPAQTNGTKTVVQRTTKTIPNISGRSSSPLQGKPRSVDDLKKLYNEKYAPTN